MSKNLALLTLLEETTTALEQAAFAMERVARELPASDVMADLSIAETFVIMSHVGRMQNAHSRLAAAHIVMKARTGAKS
jgi:hypothetical protein